MKIAYSLQHNQMRKMDSKMMVRQNPKKHNLFSTWNVLKEYHAVKIT